MQITKRKGVAGVARVDISVAELDFGAWKFYLLVCPMFCKFCAPEKALLGLHRFLKKK